jgi:hypothetical protein
MGRIGYLIDDRVAARRLAGVGERDPAESRRLAQLLFERVGVGSGYRSLLDTLPTAAPVQLATKLCVAGFRADENQWKTSGEAPKHPFVREPVAYTALTLLVAVPYLVGTVRATGTAFGWWLWGAAWFGWVTAVMVAGALLGFLLCWSWERIGRDVMVVALPTLAFFVLSLPGVVTLSVVTLLERIGLPLLVSAVLVMTAVTVGLFRTIDGRARASTNPFRELRRPDDSMVRIRSTVISRREVCG